MKILLVSLYFVEYAVELANALGEKNQVHLMLSKHRVSQTIGEQLDEKIIHNVSYTLVPYHSLIHPSILRIVFSIFKLLITFRPDVIHLQECKNFLNLLFLFFSFKPAVVTVHDVQLHPGKDTSCKFSWRLWLLNEIRKYKYGKIIVHGEKLKRQYVECYKKPAQDVFVVPHGCLFSFLSYKSKNVSEEEPHTVLFFGRIEEYKGLKYLIEAEPLVSEVFPDFRVIIAGRGDDMDAYKSSLLSNPHFEIHDRFIPNKEVASFFQRASVVVAPYIEASQSGIVAMAFAFGKPMIATDVGSLPEMVRDGKTGLIILPNNSKHLSSAIVYLLTDVNKKRKIKAEILKTVQTALSWRHIACLTQEVYKRALKNGKGRNSAP